MQVIEVQSSLRSAEDYSVPCPFCNFCVRNVDWLGNDRVMWDHHRHHDFLSKSTSWAMKKNTWLFRVYIGNAILPSYVGIIVNHYKDPYKPTRILSWGSRLIPVIQQQHWMIWDGYRSSMDYFWEWVHDQPSVKSSWNFAYTHTNYSM